MVSFVKKAKENHNEGVKELEGTPVDRVEGDTPDDTEGAAQDTGEGEGDKEQAQANLDGDALAEHARKLGAKAGKASSEAISIVMKAKEDWQGGPFRVLFGLQMDYEPEELDTFAVPDTDTGNNPDVFKIHKENAKGKVSLVDSNFYVNFADGTPDGQNILSRIEWTERAGDPKSIKDDIPEDIMAMNPHERETHLNFLKGRRNTIRQSYKKAMALYFKQKEVETYPGVSCEPIWETGKGPSDVAEGETPVVANTTKPIAIWVTPDEGKPVTKWEALSIGAFMKLNPRKAQEKGGTFQSLIESGVVKKTAGGGATSNNDKDAFVIKTVDRGVEVFAEFHRWLDEIAGAKDKAEYGKLLKLGNSKNNDEFIAALVETRNIISDICKEVKADDKYVKLQQGGSDLVKQTSKAAA